MPQPVRGRRNWQQGWWWEAEEEGGKLRHQCPWRVSRRTASGGGGVFFCVCRPLQCLKMSNTLPCFELQRSPSVQGGGGGEKYCLAVTVFVIGKMRYGVYRYFFFVTSLFHFICHGSFPLWITRNKTQVSIVIEKKSSDANDSVGYLLKRDNLPSSICLLQC